MVTLHPLFSVSRIQAEDIYIYMRSDFARFGHTGNEICDLRLGVEIHSK